MPNGTFEKPLHLDTLHRVEPDFRMSTLIVDGIHVPLDDMYAQFGPYQEARVSGFVGERSNLYPSQWEPMPELRTYRDSTDFNSKAIKDARKLQPKAYKLTLVDTPFATKVRVWDSLFKKFRTKREPGKAWRLRRIKSKLKLSGLLLKVNELITTETRLMQDWFGEIIRHMTYPENHYGGKFLASWEVDQTKKVKKRWIVSGDLITIPVDGSGHVMIPGFSYGGSPVIAELIPNPSNYAMGDRFDFFSSYFNQYEENELLARSRLFKRLKDQKLDLATGLAELSQTVGMISGAAAKLLKSFNLLKKGNVIGGTKVLFPQSRKETANVFLAYRYGVSPLMSDTSGAAEHFAQRVLNMPPVKVKGKSKSTYSSSDPNISLSSFGASSTSTINYDIEVTVKYSARYTIDETFLRELSRLGFTNPTNVAWELVPFSFVVDWLLPIGNYLSHLTTLEGLTLKEVIRTTLIRETVSCKTSVVGNPTGADFIWNLSDVELGWKMENMHFQRHILTDVEMSELRFPSPSFKNPFSTGHIANAAALIQQMVKGK